MGFGSLFGSIGKAIKKVGGGAVGTVNKAVKGVGGGVNSAARGMVGAGPKKKPVQTGAATSQPGSIFGSRKPEDNPNAGSIGGGMGQPRMGTGKKRMGMRMQ